MHCNISVLNNQHIFQGDIFRFLRFFLCLYFIQHCFICRPTDSTVSEGAGIEPRKVVTSALAVRRSSHSATSHPYSRLHLIHTRLHLIHTEFDYNYSICTLFGAKCFRCEVQITNFTDFFRNSFLALCTGLKILVNWGESYFADCVLCVKLNL